MYFRTLCKSVNYYTDLGYTFSFHFSDGHVNPENWVIVDTHRFEGLTDPSDNAILYVLEHKNGQDKGIIIDAYGANGDERIRKFLQKMPRNFPPWVILPETQVPFAVFEKVHQPAQSK